MEEQKPLFKAPYDIKDVSALFALVALILIISALIGNNLFGLFQENINFGWLSHSIKMSFVITWVSYYKRNLITGSNAFISAYERDLISKFFSL